MGDREAHDPTLGKRQIFLGSGEHSAQGVRELHRRLDNAIIILGGLQQPPRSTDPSPSPEHARVEEQIESEDRETITRIAGEIFTVLTGVDLNALYFDAEDVPRLQGGEPLDRKPTHEDLLRIATEDPVVRGWMKLAEQKHISTTESLFGMAISLSARSRALIGEIVRLQTLRPPRIFTLDGSAMAALPAKEGLDAVTS